MHRYANTFIVHNGNAVLQTMIGQIKPEKWTKLTGARWCNWLILNAFMPGWKGHILRPQILLLEGSLLHQNVPPIGNCRSKQINIRWAQKHCHVLLHHGSIGAALMNMPLGRADVKGIKKGCISSGAENFTDMVFQAFFMTLKSSLSFF